MGFYLELRRQAALPPELSEFSEDEIPVSFWFLFIVAGFALTCMGAAAFTLFGDLWRSGEIFDRLLVLAIYSSVPVYALIGLKLLLVRKYVRFTADRLEVGYRVGKLRVPVRKLTRAQIKSIETSNRRPTSNLAPREHDNPQYYIRGHWRLMVERNDGKLFALDKHTEVEMLAELEAVAKQWWKATGQ